VDEEYSEDGKNVKIMKISLKHPSEKDYSLISSAVNYKNMSDFTIQDIMVAEKVRVKTLIRSWTANKKISEIDDLDPSIMKGIVNAVREAIDMKGIF
jgi:hypothetical protein